MKKFTIALIGLITIFTINVFASAEKKIDNESKQGSPQVKTTDLVTVKGPEEFQKVIDEYKDYVSKIPVAIRDEIIAYRKEIATINKEKRLIYKKLSKESQDYLKQEQEYKKRLPINKKALINTEILGEKTQ